MRPSTDVHRGSFVTRVTIVGAGTSVPETDTPASGVLVETASTGILVDCGHGVVRALMDVRDPIGLDAVIVGHLHADHYLDLVPLRYLFPWDGFSGKRLPVLLPPGGTTRINELTAAISERDGFFEHAFEIVEYDPAGAVRVGDLTVRFVAGRHYVPAWGCVITDAAGRRIVISGDTGPNVALTDAAEAADLLIVEATLLAASEDDPERGHLSGDEALEIAERAGAGRAVLVHHRSANREALEAACAAAGGAIVGRPGLVLELGGSDGRERHQPAAGGGAETSSSASRARLR
jgi:ribonuclease BN (tRNA processing enzyme)